MDTAEIFRLLSKLPLFSAADRSHDSTDLNIFVDSVPFSNKTKGEGEISLGGELLFKGILRGQIDSQHQRGPFQDAGRKEMEFSFRKIERDEEPWISRIGSPARRLVSTAVKNLQEGRRLVLAGAPSCGKSTAAGLIAAELVHSQIKRLDKKSPEECLWQIPVKFSARQALREGVAKAAEEAFFQDYGIQLPGNMFKVAVQAGLVVPIIDGVEEWGNGDRLGTSTRLVAEFFILVGRRAPLVLTVDSRCIFMSIFDKDRVTGFGERCRDGDDIDLLELAPFCGMGGSRRKMFLALRSELPGLDKGDVASCLEEGRDPAGVICAREIEQWLDEPDPYGLMTPETRRELVHLIAREQFASGASSIPFTRVLDIIYDKIPYELRDTYHIDILTDSIFRCPFLDGDEDQGLSFSSQLMWETAFVDFLSRLISREGIGPDIMDVLSRGILNQRTALAFWMREEIQARGKMHFGRIAHLLSKPESVVDRANLSNDQRRNITIALFRLYTAFETLEGKPLPIQLPKGVSFSGARLDEIDFSDIAITKWNFDDAVLKGAYFKNSELKECSFRNVYAYYMYFQPKSITGTCNFLNARVPGAAFRLPRFDEIKLTRADLTGSLIECPPEDQGKLLRELDSAITDNTLMRDFKSQAEGMIGLDTECWWFLERNSEIQFLANRFIIEALEPSKQGTGLQILDCMDNEKTWLPFDDETVAIACPLLQPGSSDTETIAFVAEGTDKVYLVERRSGQWNHTLLPGVTPGVRVAVRPAGSDRLIVVTDDAAVELGPGKSVLKLDMPWREVVAAAQAEPGDDRLVIITHDQLFEVKLERAADDKLLTRICHKHRLAGSAVLLNVNGDTAAVGFEDNTIQLFSKRFGWASRGRHLLSFDRLRAVIVAPERGFTFVIGNWDVAVEGGRGFTDIIPKLDRTDESDNVGSIGVCILDSRTAETIIYYEIAERSRDKVVKALRKVGAQAKLHGQERLNKAEREEGRYDGTDDCSRFILQHVEWSLDDVTYVNNVPHKIEVRFEPKRPLTKLRHIYEIEGRKAIQMPLRIEVVITEPDGASHSVPTDDVVTKNSGSGIAMTVPWTFRMDGDLRLTVNMFLGPAIRTIEFETPLKSRPDNPFNYGPALGKEKAYMFYGHEKTLDKLDADIRNSSRKVCGSRRQGKSSLLFALENRLRSNARNDMLVVSMSFDSLVNNSGNSQSESAVDFVNLIFEKIAMDEKYSRQMGVEMAPRLSSPNEAKQKLQELVEEVKQVFGPNGRLVVLIDEYNAFLEFADYGEYIGTFFQDMDPTLRAIAFDLPYSRKHSKEKELDAKQNSGLFRFFQQIYYMQPLEPKEIEALAREPIRGRYNIDTDALDELVTRSAGRPYDAQVMLRSSIGRLINDNRKVITAGDVVDAFEMELTPTYRRDYFEPIEHFIKADGPAANNMLSALKDNFWDNVRIINGESEGNSAIHPHAFEYGYVSGHVGQDVHLPPALLNAWAKGN